MLSVGKGVSASVHPPYGLIVLILVLLVLVKREGLLALVGGLLIFLFLVVVVGKVDEIGECLVAIEESDVVPAA